MNKGAHRHLPSSGGDWRKSRGCYRNAAPTFNGGLTGTGDGAPPQEAEPASPDAKNPGPCLSRAGMNMLPNATHGIHSGQWN